LGDIAKATRLLEEAVFAPDRLAQTLDEAGRALGFDHFCLVHDDLNALTAVASGASLEALQVYARDGWAETDYRAANVGRVRDGKPFLDHVMVDAETRLGNPVYHDLYVPHRMAYYAGWRFTVGGSTWNLALARSEESGPVSEEEAKALESIIPIANRSLYLIHQLRETHVKGMFDGLTTSQTAAVMLHSDGKVGLVTPQAQRLFNIDFNVRDGRLWSAHAGSNARLEKVAQFARSGKDAAPESSFLIQRFNDSRTILAHPILIQSAGVGLLAGARVTLFLSTPGQTEMVTETDLQLLFGLSKAEAQIAYGLAEGLDPQEVAERRNVSVGTIRVQMKNIFHKANVHRQSELIKAIAELRPPKATTSFPTAANREAPQSI